MDFYHLDNLFIIPIIITVYSIEDTDSFYLVYMHTTWRLIWGQEYLLLGGYFRHQSGNNFSLFFNIICAANTT
jgi:hypothetical protein